jgi:hypothetical protein
MLAVIAAIDRISLDAAGDARRAAPGLRSKIGVSKKKRG